MGKEKEDEKRERRRKEFTVMGQTALDLALHEGYYEIIQLLVQEGGKCFIVCERK